MFAANSVALAQLKQAREAGVRGSLLAGGRAGGGPSGRMRRILLTTGTLGSAANLPKAQSEWAVNDLFLAQVASRSQGTALCISAAALQLCFSAALPSLQAAPSSSAAAAPHHHGWQTRGRNCRRLRGVPRLACLHSLYSWSLQVYRNIRQGGKLRGRKQSAKKLRCMSGKGDIGGATSL